MEVSSCHFPVPLAEVIEGFGNRPVSCKVIVERTPRNPYLKAPLVYRQCFVVPGVLLCGPSSWSFGAWVELVELLVELVVDRFKQLAYLVERK